MKPAFALDFRDSVIRLLHRTGGNWQVVGTVALDAPDLPEALSYLRATALGLSPRGIATKLVIPNDQVLYDRISAPGPDASSRRKQIRAALEGRTPYQVDDLVFDWWGNGPEVQVAVIARDTLAEAEAFAVEHRFNPVSFVAAPESGDFRGEPWFGPSNLAASLLASGEKVDRDQDPVTIIARFLPAEPEPEPETPAPVIEPQPQPAPAVVDQAVMVDEPATPSDPAPPAEPEVLQPPVSKPVAQQPAKVPAVETIPSTVKPVPQDPAIATERPAKIEVDTALPQKEPVAEAPMALDVADDGLDPTENAKAAPEVAEVAAPKVSIAHPSLTDDLPPMPSGPSMVAFSSRRSPGTPVKTRVEPGVKMQPPAPPKAAQGPVNRLAKAWPLPAATPTVTAARPSVGAAVRPANGTPVPRPDLASVRPGAAGKALRGLGALVTAPGIAGSKFARPSATGLGPQVSIVNDGAKPQTSAKAAKKPNVPLGSRTAPQRGKPKYLGLILTGVLLLFLALIAAWSSFSLSSLDGEGPPVQSAEISDVPAPDDEMLADMQDPADFDAPVVAPVEPAETAVAEEPAPVAAEPAPVTGIVPDAVLGVAASTDPQNDPQDEIFLAAMDAPPLAPDPLSLPQPDARGDPLPAAQLAPPPFGTIYQFDADGLIRPTPEGIITPEGVLLIAGKPPRVPPPRPSGIEAAVAAAAAAPPAVLPGATEPFPSDPSLAGARPKSRPAGLVPAPAPSAEDDASLAPAADSRVATLKPRTRPATVVAGEQARLASASASLASQTQVAVVEVSSGAQPSILISRKPAPRPRDLSRSVEAAVAAAVRSPEAEPAPAVTEASAPKKPQEEADNEPEVASAMPRLPTRANVAKQATFVNSINLSRINLIGVYGTQSSRYALIRLANGRYKRVEIGDSIDGGRVAAITSTEVRYQKGSKMVTLALPKG